MAQLIKLGDYISRYEVDIFRYASQFNRLKRKRWEELNHLQEPVQNKQDQLEKEAWFDQSTVAHKLKKFFFKIKSQQEIIHEDLATHEPTPEEIKQSFLQELYHFQLKWASTTLTERSFIDTNYKRESSLRYLLTQFPDNYLVMYKPIFILNKAPVEADVIIIGPNETWSISILEHQHGSYFRTDKGHFWYEYQGESERKVINPLLSINRTAKIIGSIYHKYEHDLPVQKLVLCQNGYVGDTYVPQDTQYIDSKVYNNWYDQMVKRSTPLKFKQLQAAQSLLRHCQSTFVHRPEWIEEQEDEDDESL